MGKVDLTKIIRADISDMASYKAAPFLSDLEEKYASSKDEIIKLDQGENPYGSPPSVREALSKVKDIFNYYPDPEYKKLRTAISKYVGVDIGRIMVGSGSDELSDLILRLVINEGDEIINCSPTYGMYPLLITLNKGKAVVVRRNEDYSLNVQAIIEKVNDRTKAILICSPNNPTGNLATEQEIRALLDTGKLVVVDEAYFEFCNKTVIHLSDEYNNLIIMRTFSKWAGLAGLRLGYAIMDPRFVSELMKIKLPFNVNLAAEIGGLAALENVATTLEMVNRVVVERDRVYGELKDLPGFKTYPSYGNFLLIEAKGSLSDVRTYLDNNQIFPRYYEEQNALRLTIGTPEQNDKVVARLKSFKASA
jgi:histidinol-phosphate aminotransferase